MQQFISHLICIFKLVIPITFVLFRFISNASGCVTEVICTGTGPPTWTYDYQSMGSTVDPLLGFKLSGVDGVTDTGAPGLFFGTIGSSDVTFEVAGCGTLCGTDHSGFRITASGPYVENGTIEWSDLAYLSSFGYVEGPVSSGAPTPTPTLLSVPVSSGHISIFILFSLIFIFLFSMHCKLRYY